MAKAKKSTIKYQGKKVSYETEKQSISPQARAEAKAKMIKARTEKIKAQTAKQKAKQQGKNARAQHVEQTKRSVARSSVVASSVSGLKQSDESQKTYKDQMTKMYNDLINGNSNTENVEVTGDNSNPSSSPKKSASSWVTIDAY